jgi:hypothetical protein
LLGFFLVTPTGQVFLCSLEAVPDPWILEAALKDHGIEAALRGHGIEAALTRPGF